VEEKPRSDAETRGERLPRGSELVTWGRLTDHRQRDTCDWSHTLLPHEIRSSMDANDHVTFLCNRHHVEWRPSS